MTPEQVQLVQTSSVALLTRADEWSERFYVRLFEARPDARPLFPADLVSQRAKFVEEIVTLLSLVSDLDAFERRAADLGAAHVGYGVRAAHYRASGTALAESVTDVLGADATPEVVDAWRSVHDLVAEAMMAGGTSVPLA